MAEAAEFDLLYKRACGCQSLDVLSWYLDVDNVYETVSQAAVNVDLQVNRTRHCKKVDLESLIQFGVEAFEKERFLFCLGNELVVDEQLCKDSNPLDVVFAIFDLWRELCVIVFLFGGVLVQICKAVLELPLAQVSFVHFKVC